MQGEKYKVELNDVWGCPYASGIILADPILFGISYGIAVGNSTRYCEEQSDLTCRLPGNIRCGDSDADSLLDIWETDGIDGDGDGSYETFLPGANISRLDAYLEIDCLKHDGDGDGHYDGAADHSHCPSQNAIYRVVKAFADAPRLNVDRTHGIQLHVDVGPLFGTGRIYEVQGSRGVTGTYGDLGGGGQVIDETGNDQMGWDVFDALKGDHFAPQRARAYRYALFAHQLFNDCTSGIARSVPSRDFIVSLGGLRTDVTPIGPCWGADANGRSVGTEAQQAGTLMHELGHAFGLGHGGADSVNYKPNYLSVMNYAFQQCGVPASPSGAAAAPGGCTYSANVLDALDERALDECAGIDSGALGFGRMNWNGNRSSGVPVFEGPTCPAPNQSPIEQELNRDNLCVAAGPDSALASAPASDDQSVPPSLLDGPRLLDGPNHTCDSTATGDDAQIQPVGTAEPILTSHDDWQALKFGIRFFRQFAAGEHGDEELSPTPADIERARAVVGAATAPDIGVEVQVPPSVLPGEQLTYLTRISSRGRGPGLQAAALLQGPDGSDSSVPLGGLLVGTTRDIASTYTVPATACPMSLVQTSLVDFENFVAEPLAISASGASQVLDVVPPTITLQGPSSSTLECSVDQYVELGASASDTCDAEVPIVVGGDSVSTAVPGNYTVRYTAQDDSGNRSYADRSVTIADRTPPTLGVRLSPNLIWPPNHALIPIGPSLTVSDACDAAPVTSLVDIKSNQPANGKGDGNTSSDIVVDAHGNIFLRAERAGNANRIYTLTFQARDASNNVTRTSATVTVGK